MRYVVHNHFPARDTDTLRGFPEAMAQARSIDPLRYLVGLKKLTFVGDPDKWNASYTPDTDEVTIEAKFHKKTFNDKVQTLLHEAGHRGQLNVDKGTFRAFMAGGLDRLSYFLAMANGVHQEDFRENGIAARELADEIFAESYSRFALGMDMPVELKDFWTERAAR